MFGGVSWARFLLKLVLGDSGLSGAEARPFGGLMFYCAFLRGFREVAGCFLGDFSHSLTLLSVCTGRLYWWGDFRGVGGGGGGGGACS